MTLTKAVEKPKKSLPITSLLLGLAVGGLSGWAGMRFASLLMAESPSGADTNMPSWLPLLFVVVACFGGLFLHELGHLLAGIKVGFIPYLFAVGPLRIDREEQGKYRVTWNRTVSLWGGAVAILPPSDYRTRAELLRDFAFIIAAGPIMSLSIAALRCAGIQIIESSSIRLK
jgi:hypothetical protein